MNVLKRELIILLKISNTYLLILVMIAYGFKNLVFLSLLVQSKDLTKFNILFFINVALQLVMTAPFLKFIHFIKKTTHSSNLREENCQDYHTIGFKQSS